MSKSLEAVFYPERSPVLEDIRNQSDFESLWEANRKAALAGLAHAAYLAPEDGESVVARFGGTFRGYDEDGAQACLALWNDFGVLAFRGSEPAEDAPTGSVARVLKRLKVFGIEIDESLATLIANDVIGDAKVVKVGFRDRVDVRVHRGFLGEFDKVWEPIRQDLPDGLPVWATGHSLGAALATLAGLSYPFEEVVTFGEPLVGTGVSNDFRAKKHLRVVNGDDPVTKVPPGFGLPFGYEHHGDEFQITDPGGDTDFRYDHSIVYYVDNLRADTPGPAPKPA